MALWIQHILCVGWLPFLVKAQLGDDAETCVAGTGECGAHQGDKSESYLQVKDNLQIRSASVESTCNCDHVSALIQTAETTGAASSFLPTSCEPFCHDNGCACVVPWEHRCKLRSCMACAECNNTAPHCTAPVQNNHNPGDPVLVCPTTAAVTTQCMTQADYDAVVASVQLILNNLDTTCAGMNCPQADFAGCVLRMAGHDFMDFNPNTNLGGSNGCTNFDHKDNKGLLECMKTGDNGNPNAALQAAYAQHCAAVSLADFFVIAAEAVMLQTRLWATGGTQDLQFPSTFKYGRTTAATCPEADGTLPDPERGCTDVSRVFENNLGLSRPNAVALMGVHTLGRAHVQFSGYEGWWSDAKSSRKFNNNYYASMLAKGWRANRSICGDPTKNMWSRSDSGRSSSELEMMLDTDICLAYSVNGRPVMAKADTCCAWMERPSGFVNGVCQQSGGCGISPAVINAAGTYCGTPPGGNLPAFGSPARFQCCSGFAQDCGDPRFNQQTVQQAFAVDSVEEFASNEAAWLTAFAQAWSHVTELGHSNLKQLGVCGSP